MEKEEPEEEERETMLAARGGGGGGGGSLLSFSSLVCAFPDVCLCCVRTEEERTIFCSFMFQPGKVKGVSFFSVCSSPPSPSSKFVFEQTSPPRAQGY